MSLARAFFVVVLLASPAALARTIEGTVREAGTRRPVPGAAVSVQGVEVYSDDTGAFVLEISEGGRGDVKVVVETAGYRRAVENVRIEAEQGTTRVDLFLEPDPDETGTVVRERRSRGDVARGAHRIEGREVNELPGTYGDPAKAIENFPGMGRVVQSQGSLFVRGADPGESAVYVDDYEIPDLYHFTGSTSVINIPFVESVELVPGAFSARYGRATGGLVTLKTRKLPTDDVHGFAKLDIIDGGAYVGVPLSPTLAVGASARRSYLDGIRHIQRATSGTGDAILQIPTYWDYQLKLDYDVAPGSEVQVFAFGSGDREEYLRDVGENVDPYRRTNDSDFHRVAFTWKQNIGAGMTHQLTPVIGYERRSFDEQDGLRFRDRQSFDLQLRDELVVRTGDSRIVAGFDGTLRHDAFVYGGQLANSDLREVPTADDEALRDRSAAAEAGRGTLAFYAEGTFEPLPGLELTPGVRFDGYWLEDLPDLSIEPRFAAQLVILDEEDWTLALKAATGLFGRPADAEDVAAARAAGTRLPIQHALHIQGGFEQGLGLGRALSATLFTNWRDEQTTRSLEFPVPDEPGLPAVVSGGASQSYGLELLLRAGLPGRYYGWAAYSISKTMRNDAPGTPLAVPYAYPSMNDTTHLLALVAQVQLIWGFRVGARYRIASGMPRTDVVGASYDADSGRFAPRYGPKGAERFPMFQSLDVRLDWSWLLPWFELDAYADIVNVLNLRGEEARIYDYDYAQHQSKLGLPIIPTVGAKITF